MGGFLYFQRNYILETINIVPYLSLIALKNCPLHSLIRAKRESTQPESKSVLCALFLCLLGAQHSFQRVRCCCIRALNGMTVYFCRCGRGSMSQTVSNRSERDTARDLCSKLTREHWNCFSVPHLMNTSIIYIRPRSLRRL